LNNKKRKSEKIQEELKKADKELSFYERDNIVDTYKKEKKKLVSIIDDLKEN